jgi:hypothetical protein
MTGHEAALARSQSESLRRISKDWVDIASSLETKEAGRSVRDLTRPPSLKKTVRTAGIALAVAPEPFTTAAGVALFAGSFAMRGEPATLKSVTEELGRQVSIISDFDLNEFTISI